RAGKSIGALAATQPPERREETIVMLDAHVTAHVAGGVTVKRACAAFGVNERSYHHRRQRDEGRLPRRFPAEPKVRAPHPASLSPAEKDQIIAALCEPRFVDLAP